MKQDNRLLSMVLTLSLLAPYGWLSAAESKQSDCLKEPLLIKGEAQQKDQQLLEWCVKTADYQNVAGLIAEMKEGKRLLEITKEYDDGQTLLHRAVSHGYPCIDEGRDRIYEKVALCIKHLVDAKCNVNKIDKNGISPLHAAVLGGSPIPVMNTLLFSGARVTPVIVKAAQDRSNAWFGP